MSSSALIGLWATGTWIDLGSPSYLSALTISGYASVPNTLGMLNTYISTCYSGSGFTGFNSVNYDVVPDLTYQELALIDAMYRASYYNNLAQATMGGGGGAIPFSSIAEGDTKIAQNPAAIGLAYIGLAKDQQARLKYLVNVYLNQVQGADVPRQVLFPGVVGPLFSNAYWGL